MKVAIFTENVENWLPKVIENSIEYLNDLDDIYKRIELVNRLNVLPCTHKNAEELEIEDYLVSKKDKFVNGVPFTYVRNQTEPNKFIFAEYIEQENEEGKPEFEVKQHTVDIIDVDTTLVWGIRVNDKAEHIEYAQKSEVVNENLNYVKWY